MSQTTTSQIGADAIATPASAPTYEDDVPINGHHSSSTQLGKDAIAHPTLNLQDDEDLEYHDLPPFPSDVPQAPLLRIQLSRLLAGDTNEQDRLYKACCDLGFFYLDLRDHGASGLKSPEHEELTQNVWKEHANGHAKEDDSVNGTGASRSLDVAIDGEQLIRDAAELFGTGEELFDLPVEEKVKYDNKAKGSYYGYKGYGDGVVDATGTRDRNEFYNVSKDDILGITERLPAPDVLDSPRPLLKSFMQQSHSIVTLILRLLNSRLQLPPDTLPSLHRLGSVSSDVVRWVHAPPQPTDDRKLSLGEHTDFGSVTVLFNRLGGLQVLPPDSQEWCYVKPLRGHAVVNLGDAMVKFTAGVLRSNIHRVINPPGEQADHTRMSLVYFARPEDAIVLKTLEGSEAIDARKREGGVNDGEEITAKEWVLRRALGRRTGGDWEKSSGTEGERIKY